jgi:hypothetical protein
MLYTPAEAGAVNLTGAPEVLEVELKLPPVADQLTPVESLVVAVTEKVWATARAARLGEIVMLMPAVAEVTVIVALAFLLLLLTDVAVRVTTAGEGTLAGAV